MNKVRILTDSTADLGDELYKKYDIDVVSGRFAFGEETFRDNGKEMTLEQLYKKVEKTKELPHTSAVPPAEFEEYFKKAVADGYDVVYIGLGSKLSTTFQNAHIASQEFPKGRIFLVDSESLSTGIGLLVLRAAKLRDEGLSAKEIAEKVQPLSKKAIAQFTVEGLDYLHKGGRCSGASKLLGHIFHIHPYLRMVNGTLIVYKKPRGPMKIAIKEQLNELASALPNVELDHVFITHALMDPELEKWTYEELKKLVPAECIHITHAGGVIASHCGYGTIGILYLLK